MLCFKSNTLKICIFLFVSIFGLFVPLTSGSPDLLHIVRRKAVEAGVESQFAGVNGVVSFDSLKVPEGNKEENSTVLILAEQRTRRRDPLDAFHKYTGGWNISNKHYWASVGFTGAPFFVAAIVWFVLFGICLCFICLCYCCCRKEPYGYSSVAYALSLTILIFFTLVAIVGCIVLYTGQDKFHNSTCKTLGYVVNQADTTAQNLRNVTDYLSAAKSIGVQAIVLPMDIQNTIDGVMGTVKNAANILSEKVEENSKRIQNGLDIIRLALVILAAIMVSLVFVGFVFSIFGLECLVYCLVILGWILVTGTFILCGVFLQVHNVFADACLSMDEWVQKHPTAHTALDDILPCVNKEVAQQAMTLTREATYNAVNVLNRVAAEISTVNPGTEGPLNFNQSGPPLPFLCNPYTENRTERKCVPGETPMQEAPQVWKKYVCEVSPAGICIGPGRLTPNYYDQLSAFVNVSYALYRYSPFFVDLVDCTFVRDAFSDISQQHCPGLRIHSAWIYIGLFMVSTAVMMSLIFWVIYARERRHRVYTKKVLSSRVWEDPGLEFSQTYSRNSSRASSRASRASRSLRTSMPRGFEDRAA